MSITDRVVLACAPALEKPYDLRQNGEQIRDEHGEVRRWLQMEEAVEWCEEHFGVSPFDHLPETGQESGARMMKDWRESGQRRLL